MKKIIPVLFIFSLLAIPLFVGAQSGGTVGSILCNILNTIKVILVVIGVGVAVILLIVGGIQYMTSGGDAEKSGKARKMIVNALIGFVIVVAAVFLVALVQSFLQDSQILLINNPCQLSY